MLYVIIGTDRANSLEKRQASRAAHLERANQLTNDGRMVLAGPFPAIDSPDPGPAGFTGSLIVAEFESLDEALEWANADPYVTSGAWERVEVMPFKQVLP